MKCPTCHFIEILQTYSGAFEGVGVLHFEELTVDHYTVCGPAWLETQRLSVGKAKKGPEQGLSNHPCQTNNKNDAEITLGNRFLRPTFV